MNYVGKDETEATPIPIDEFAVELYITVPLVKLDECTNHDRGI